MNLNCTAHQPTADIFDPRCVRCGARLLDQNISPADLLERLRVVDPETKTELTGRQRGTWVEVLEEGDLALFAYWVRPASNVAGFEAVDHPAENPTGEELSRAFLVEMLSAPAATPEPLPEPSWATSHRKPARASRLARLWAYRPSEDTAQFLPLAAGLVATEALVVGWLLGWSGVVSVFGAVWSLFS
ncbi:hypothetical protein OG866_06995 [Streptomyces sp. NBC_00663]|uniref:hypothetical protein n=1 Tax=Streptomyces sp. NBC_00663 TaxID=2975801 RepID=UPI002E32900F|nr:hypothetical protein [Streptomyces sp. NBC_00663]